MAARVIDILLHTKYSSNSISVIYVALVSSNDGRTNVPAEVGRRRREPRVENHYDARAGAYCAASADEEFVPHLPHLGASTVVRRAAQVIKGPARRRRASVRSAALQSVCLCYLFRRLPSTASFDFRCLRPLLRTRREIASHNRLLHRPRSVSQLCASVFEDSIERKKP